MRIAGLLLAAGHSRRFGGKNKLLETLWGRPLLARTADILNHADVGHRIAVTSSARATDLLNGWKIVSPQPGNDQAASLRAGLKCAIDLDVDRIVVLLGDMPLVTPELVNAVIDRCSEKRPAAAFDGRNAKPPVCFPRSLFRDLRKISGDVGARQLIRGLPEEQLVRADDITLCDIDRPEDLRKLNSHPPERK